MMGSVAYTQKQRMWCNHGVNLVLGSVLLLSLIRNVYLSISPSRISLQTNAYNIFLLGITLSILTFSPSSNACPSRSHRFIILYTNRLRLSCWLQGSFVEHYVITWRHGMTDGYNAWWPSRVWLMWHREMAIDIRQHYLYVGFSSNGFLSSYKLLGAIAPLMANVVRQR